MKSTYRRLYEDCSRKLEAAGVPDAQWDAWLLLEHCFELNRSSYFLNRNKEQEFDEKKLAEFLYLSEQRKQRIPLQYLLGTQEFMGLPFCVDHGVLIPRADTETLVETVLSECRASSGLRLLDVCTGSGCIAIALCCLGRFAQVDALDLSGDALRVAEKNAAVNHADIRLIQSNLFEQVREKYDVIVSNPPYIAGSVIAELEPEVRDHEPRMALDGGEDGLVFYRRIAQEAGNYLMPGGRMYLEIGYDQGEAVSGLLREHGFLEIRIIKDLAGNDRVVACKVKEGGIRDV